MATEHVYTVTIELGAEGTDEQKEQLLENMIKRIGEENSIVGEATCRVTSVVEVEGD